MACTRKGIFVALGIMVAGLLAAVLGTSLAIALGLNLSSALFFYGLFGVCGGIVACLAGLPMLRNQRRNSSPDNRTAG